MSPAKYDHKKVEESAQRFWKENKSFEVSENSKREKFYCLSMFPYPSGQLHMGHVRNYTLGDVIGRFQRLKGKNVMQPMGWDAFGLPAENAAIKRKIAPADWTKQNIAYMRGQLQKLGFAFDWSREFSTSDPTYYRWEQWFFLRLFEKGLVYKKAAMVNWDPVDKTVLANEQVIDGLGWRSNAPVERKELEQWFVKITDYAKELLENLDDLQGWPEKVKTMQRNWIGRSEGVQISFALTEGSSLQVYTTRPDTLFGVTYIAVAPQHPLMVDASKRNRELSDFILACNRVKVAEADMAKLEKKGMFTGLYAKHPITEDAIPIWVANFVLIDYGSGAVMSVPGHDQRDWEFAKKYDLPIKNVVSPGSKSNDSHDLEKGAFVGKGILVNSGDYDGLNFSEAFSEITKELEKRGKGRRQVNYRLRDWGVSRQRYWGCPIPIINCKDCGSVPVPDKDLPVILPTEVEFEGVGSPLKTMSKWYTAPCPNCGKEAKRETDTFDTFMESSWYYARFGSSDSDNAMLDNRANYWGSVDHYVGGEEHAILHLLYARFFHKAMRDEGLVDSDEPFVKLLALGMVLQGGSKMSKSAGDAGDPQHLMDQYGSDAVRMAMMFSAPPDQAFEWAENGVEAASKWLRTKLWNTVQLNFDGISDHQPIDHGNLNERQRELRRKTFETLQKCEDDFDRRLTFNTVIAAVMSLINQVIKFDDDSAEGRAIVFEALKISLQVMSPITPHICHELWKKLGLGIIEESRWPEIDKLALEKTSVEIAVQVNGKVRGKLISPINCPKEELIGMAKQEDNIKKFLFNKSISKIIHVPNKILNFVVL
ncbi:leucine--tRNA ligase [Gammaproteobacteria bacterium]|nr:leucine--tRNA ligase [Gammaproteobacteria bacterium]